MGENHAIRTRLAHIQEELKNNSPILFNISEYYPKIEWPTLIVGATQPMIEDVIMLPDEIVKRMLREISNATRVDIDTTHVGSILHPNIERDQAILNFLALN